MANNQPYSPKPKRSRRMLYVLVSLLLLAGLGWWGLHTVGVVTLENHEGYFGPALSPDGRSVWFFQRNASGLAVGMGWEFFSPPARVFLRRDELTLRRYDLESGQVETLQRWPSSPLAGKKLSHYRGRILGSPTARIRLPQDGTPEYAANMTHIRQPHSQIWSISGTWDGPGSARPDWKEGGTSTAGLSDPVVVEDLEVMTLRGEEGFNAAIVLLDHNRRLAKVLVCNKAYRHLYPEGASFEVLLEFSRKQEMDRRDEMRRTRQELVATYRNRGMSEGDALLAAGKEMARLGWWPTPAAIKAREVAEFPEHLRVFTIDPMELRVGLFADLKQAMDHPGEPVERRGRYVRHRDYSTSEELNAFLETKPEEFGLQVEGRKWHMILIPPRPASR